MMEEVVAAMKRPSSKKINGGKEAMPRKKEANKKCFD